MSERLYLAEACGVDPHANLALEECLLDVAARGARVLYLWQNARTVVIGRNQNALDECDLAALSADGGKLARRLSGGGAVYHDLGNLNFTFLVPAELWDLDAQVEVLMRALRRLGIDAERSGRNDLTIGGRKFSGHAFYHRGDASYHHGTLMVDVEAEPLGRYLSVSPLKLGAKGVSSVRSRVVNLVEVAPGITVEGLRRELAASFGEVFGGTAEPLPDDAVDAAVLAERCERYRSDAWLLRDVRTFERSRSARFAWGTVRMDWTTEGGRIADAALWSDGLDADLLERIPAELIGMTATAEGVAERLRCIGAASDMADDLASLF